MEDQINVPDVTSTAENCLQILEDGNQQKNLNEINLCKLVEGILQRNHFFWFTTIYIFKD